MIGDIAMLSSNPIGFVIITAMTNPIVSSKDP
jgi:hypothetical protein